VPCELLPPSLADGPRTAATTPQQAARTPAPASGYWLRRRGGVWGEEPLPVLIKWASASADAAGTLRRKVRARLPSTLDRGLAQQRESRVAGSSCRPLGRDEGSWPPGTAATRRDWLAVQGVQAAEDPGYIWPPVVASEDVEGLVQVGGAGLSVT